MKDKNHDCFRCSKAFHKIQHPFKIKTLNKLGIEGTCLNKIKTVYDNTQLTLYSNSENVGTLWLQKLEGINLLNTQLFCFLKNIMLSPGWCGSVDWMSTWEPRGHWFNPQSEYTPGLRAMSPVWGVWEATAHWCFPPSLSPSVPLCLKNIKIKSF